MDREELLHLELPSLADRQCVSLHTVVHVAAEDRAVAGVFLPCRQLVRNVGGTAGAADLCTMIWEFVRGDSPGGPICWESAAMALHSAELPLLILLLSCRNVFGSRYSSRLAPIS